MALVMGVVVATVAWQRRNKEEKARQLKTNEEKEEEMKVILSKLLHIINLDELAENYGLWEK